MGLLWHATGRVEVGIDGFMQMRDAEGAVSAVFVGVQSRVRADLLRVGAVSFTYPCQAAELDYWLHATLPIVLVISDPERDEAYWMHVQGYFSVPSRRRSRTVRFDKARQRFDASARPAIDLLFRRALERELQLQAVESGLDPSELPAALALAAGLRPNVETAAERAALTVQAVAASARRVNLPGMPNLEHARSIAEAIRAAPRGSRAAALDAVAGAAAARGGPPRMFFALRVTLFAASLRLRGVPGCAEKAEEIVQRSLRDHLFDFPDDATGRAAHRLELALTPYYLRSFLRQEEELRSAWAPLDPPIGRLAEVAATAVWWAIPTWDARMLDALASTFEAELARIWFVPTERSAAYGPAHDPYLDAWRAVDPLQHATAILARNADPLFEMDAAIEDRLVQLRERGARVGITIR
jgi:hypothetical protein